MHKSSTRFRGITRALLALMVLIPLLSCGAVASELDPAASPAPLLPLEIPQVNPYGPTVASPATLSALGVPEFEIFYSDTVGSPGAGYDRQRRLPLLAKYTFAPQWMFSVSSDGPVEKALGDDRNSGFGDPTFAIKYMYLPPQPGASSQALQFSWKTPTGDPAAGISSGYSDYSLLWCYSRELGDVHVDFNEFPTWLADSQGARYLQFNEALAFTIPITSSFNYQAEIYHYGSAGPNVASVVSTLHALSYYLSPTCCVSVAVDLGISPDAPVRSYLLGVVFNTGSSPLPPTQGGNLPR